MAVCIGCLRAVTFGDPAAIVWLDVSPTVWRVLLAQLVFGAMADATVWAVERKGLQHFELAFGLGGAFIYAVFVAFLGPAFVTGMCRDFAPNATHVWVQRALECTNATVVGGWTNTTLNATLRAWT